MQSGGGLDGSGGGHAGFVTSTAGNESWQRYSLVGGHKREDETFRECLIREIREELGLTEGVHFHAGAEPVARLEFEAWSERAREQTAYTFEVVPVALTPPDAKPAAGSDTGGSANVGEALQLIDANAANRWLSRQEIAAGRTSEGRLVSEILQQVLDRAPSEHKVPSKQP